MAFTIRDIWLNFRFFGEYDEKFSSKSRAHLSIKNSFQSKYNCAPSKILIQSSLPIKVPSFWEFIITSLIRVQKTIIIFQLILKDRGASEFSVYICSIFDYFLFVIYLPLSAVRLVFGFVLSNWLSKDFFLFLTVFEPQWPRQDFFWGY